MVFPPPLADRVTALQMHNVNRIEFAYDGFGRVTGRTYSNTSGANRRVTTYTYQDVGTDKTTTLLKSVNNSGFGELGYEYDAVGNITQITKDGTVQESYTYDDLNQLKTVTRNGITTEYNYQNGNITSVTQNGTVIKTYGYTDSTWSDLLTSFNGQTITYDEIGNPLQYRDGMSFTWAKGRQLQSVTKDGLTASYTYDENGLRLSKTVNGVTTNIFRTNGQMVGMNSSDGKDMTFMLDGNGNVYGVHYDHYSSNQPKSETYYFAFNAQGDVIGIYEFSGRLMASYDYDEWGNCTVNVLAADNNGHAVDSPDHIAYANPFRYRGYFYDAETGLYYVSSRYYDPEIGRFINADSQLNQKDGILGYNMFAYCHNNPIMYSDPTGHSITLACIIIGAVIGAVAGGCAGAYVSKKQTGKVNGWAVAAGAVGGGVVGGLVGWGVGAAITAVGAAATGSAATAAAPVVQQVAEKASTALQTYYPPNDGFSGAVQKITLEAGTLIQRTGDLVGRYIAPAGTPTQMLSLPYDKIGQPTTILQVQQSVEVLAGRVAPWFGQIGGGIQYQLGTPLDQLISEGIIKIFGG